MGQLEALIVPYCPKGYFICKDKIAYKIILKYVDKIKIAVIVIIEQTKQTEQNEMGSSNARKLPMHLNRNSKIKGGVSDGWF